MPAAAAAETRSCGKDRSSGRRGEIPRANVAQVIARCFDIYETSRKNFDLLSGETPIEAVLPGL